MIADLLQFDLCDFVRRFNSEEIYQIYVESLKQIASEELLAKFENIVNDYVLNKDDKIFIQNPPYCENLYFIKCNFAIQAFKNDIFLIFV